MKAQFDYLISSIDRISIPDQLVNDLVSGSKYLMLRHTHFSYTYTDDNRLIILLNTDSYNLHVVFGDTLGGHTLHWPRDKIADLLKYLFIFHYLYVAPKS